MISLIILGIVFVLIAIRQIGNIKLQIWQVMLGGAAAVIMLGQISIPGAIESINLDVIFFLFGMFVVGEALDKSGYLSHLAYNFFKNAESVDALFMLIIFGMGTLSVFLMNDTVAIIGTPLMLLLARNNNLPVKMLLLALAFSITTGSVMSPIGNPQNLLIAVNGNLSNAFVTFSRFLFIPTMINLFAVFFVLKIFHMKNFKITNLNHVPSQITNKKLAAAAKLSLSIIIVLIFVKIALIFVNPHINFKLTYIALAAAFPVVITGKNGMSILKRIDWHTLIFFAAMFVLMQSVWDSGYFQSIIKDSHLRLTSVFMILTVGVFLSQLISNVPLVALYLPVLIRSGVSTHGLMALAAGSTIAGNLFILGAASNIIIIQNAEKKSGDTISFIDFAKIGIPLTIINVLVYYIYLKII